MADVLDRLKTALADRYTLERELGAGGMATVYLAHDQKLGRAVALKVLKPELAAALGPERFLREIEIAAKLTHPNILGLYDCGTASLTEPSAIGDRPSANLLYYTMPYVEGESLRDRLTREKQLPLDDALQITREVADALGYAHALGLVHRDIKPENILFQAGHALVADFGIAKAIAAAGSERLTETGLAIGTPAYMSPEQAAGHPELDGRSDLYSLGSVLYEMLAGDPPFYASTPQAVLAKKLSEAVPRISVVREAVPPSIEAALSKVLARTAADRYRTAAEFAGALAHPDTVRAAATRARPWWRRRAVWVAAAACVVLAAAAAIVVRFQVRPELVRGRAPRTAIAVLPFENLSAAGPNSYFAGGLHDEVLSQLQMVSALSVRARTSVMGYGGSTKPPRQIGAELAVGSIVQASVQVLGSLIRVTVWLIDPATDSQVWAHTYDGSLDSAFAVQSAIAQQIAVAVGAKLSPAEAGAIAAAPTRNPEAYQLYLQGEQFRLKPCCYMRNFKAAQQLYEQAIALDSGFALAHASLSQIHGLVYFLKYADWPERPARARVEAETALRLAPRSPQAHYALAMYYANCSSSLSDARRMLRELQIALEGMPGSGELWDAISLAYFNVGDWEGVRAADARRAALDPLNQNLILQEGNGLWIRHLYSEAVAAWRRGLVLDTLVSWPKDYIALVYAIWQGQLDSLRALVRARGCGGNVPFCMSLALWEHRPDSIVSFLRDRQRPVKDGQDGYEPAQLWVGWAHELRGDTAAARRAFAGVLTNVDPLLDSLPDEWRFHAARGLALAGLGRRAEAKREAEWLLAPADSMVPIWSQWRRTPAAMILAQAGYADDALVQIERLLMGPSWGMSGPLLRLDPRWDPIRHDPRFQALLARFANPYPVG